MVAKLRQDVLPFEIERSEEPLIARAGLVLPYEMARALKLPQVIDRELPECVPSNSIRQPFPPKLASSNLTGCIVVLRLTLPNSLIEHSETAEKVPFTFEKG